MTKLERLLDRNVEFAATDVRKNTPRLPFLPHRGSTSSPASTREPTRTGSSASASPRRLLPAPSGAG